MTSITAISRAIRSKDVSESAKESIRITRTGKIMGIRKNNTFLYKGIPYAKPPVGDRRWKAPEALPDSSDLYHATLYPDSSLQRFTDPDGMYTKEFYSDPAYDANSSEDCLYLNIQTPENALGKALPVVVWIHGGGFEHGYSYESEFDGEAYCDRDILYVSIQYRVGALGFLYHPLLSHSDSHGENLGILDQIAALSWIHENIAAFGGNPHEITLMGQSAGGISTQILCSSPLSRPYMKRAIIQSGACYQTGLGLDLSRKHALKIGMEFAEICQLKQKEDFYSLSADKILNATAVIMENTARRKEPLPFCPHVDDFVLHHSLDYQIQHDEIAPVPYLLGSTKDDLGEGILYQESILFAEQRNRVASDSCYAYYFTRPLPGSLDGSFHSSELWYTFGTLRRCWRPWSPTDYRISSQMIDYWSHFIRYGTPGTVDGFQWKPCTAEDPFLMEFH
ncbi:MAG: carboxylesterase family protein [Lachnospiraceae bacterium]|nr:carboxylesterase family protein [Lachnospiraceae bacterium]